MRKSYFSSISLTHLAILLPGVFVLLSSTLLLTACNTPLVVRYEGPVKPNSEIAKFHHKTEEGWYISEIDGEDLANNMTTWSGNVGVKEIHLLPGEHVIQGSLHVDGKVAYFYLKSMLQAGKEYQMGYQIMDGVVEDRVKIFVKDLDDIGSNKDSVLH